MHDQNDPKFQENIFDVALKGADTFADNNQVIETLRKQFETGRLTGYEWEIDAKRPL